MGQPHTPCSRYRLASQAMLIPEAEQVPFQATPKPEDDKEALQATDMVSHVRSTLTPDSSEDIITPSCPTGDIPLPPCSAEDAAHPAYSAEDVTLPLIFQRTSFPFWIHCVHLSSLWPHCGHYSSLWPCCSCHSDQLPRTTLRPK